jgi:hypothetical protein
MSDGERSDVWSDTRQRARKVYACSECDDPILVGQVYSRVGSLHDGSWTTNRCHVECHDLAKYIALDLSGDDVYYLGVESMRSQVREACFNYEARDILRRYAACVRGRRKIARDITEGR